MFNWNKKIQLFAEVNSNDSGPRPIGMTDFAVILSVLFFAGNLPVLAAGEAVDFDTQVIPILTKSGCNSGACHGAAAGRGEFHLSLYGSNPEVDFNSIVHEYEGRRINQLSPGESLILYKATESISHGGGPRFDTEGAEVAILTDWIAQGGRRLNTRTLKSFQIEPAQFVLNTPDAEVKLTATAEFSHATPVDVTTWTVLTPEDSSAVEVNSTNGSVRVLRPGRHIVIARYLDQVIPIILLRPATGQPVQISDCLGENFIDPQVAELLRILKISPSPPANDSTFLRRISLDLTGRLPTPQAAQELLTDPEKFTREQYIDKLLSSEEFNDYWSYEFAKLLRLRSQPQDKTGAAVYHAWLREQIAQATPYDQIAKTLLLAQGDSHEYGPANFYRTTSGPREMAEFVSELFMGSRLRCANCHDHPLDHWTQDDYHGLAAIFAGTKAGRDVSFTTGEVIHPRTGEAAQPRIPGDRFLDEKTTGRLSLADWMTSPDNPYFAKAIVNRLWKRLMGRGLIEPTDDLRATNPATHPELLDLLTRDFIAHHFDLRHTIRQIVTSEAYARSEVTTPDNAADDRFYSHALSRPLEPEVLADAIADVTGVPITYGDSPVGMRAIQLRDTSFASTELETLGRCSREESCENQEASNGGLSLMLSLLNGELLNQRIQAQHGTLATLIKLNKMNQSILDELYLRGFARLPNDPESKFWSRELAQATTSVERKQMLEDIFWAILTSNEFKTNH